MKYFLVLLCSVALAAKELHPIAKANGWLNEEKERTEGRFFKFAALATVDADGNPHNRMIEITKLTQKEGAFFFTHAKTQIMAHLRSTPRASLNFYLPKTHRQMTMNGRVYQLSQNDAEKAWKRFPRFMQLIFITTNKDEPLGSAEILEKRKKIIDGEYPQEIPFPQTFVGFRLEPENITFYQMNHRSFPTKEIACLTNSQWVCTKVEP